MTATGGLAFESSDARVEASWRDVDAAQLVAAESAALVSRRQDALPARSQQADESIRSKAGTSTHGWCSRAGSAGAGVSRPPGKRDSISRRGSGDSRRTIDWRCHPGRCLAHGPFARRKCRGLCCEGTLHASESDLQAILQMLSEAGWRRSAGSRHRSHRPMRMWKGPLVGRSCIWSSKATRRPWLDKRLSAFRPGGVWKVDFDLEELTAAQPPCLER